MRDRAGKDKGMLKTVLVEKPERANAKAGQWELRSESERVQKLRAEYANKTYDNIVISSLF